MVTVFNTELAIPLAPVSAWPEDDVALRTFCASRRVLRRLAAAVAEIPWDWEESIEREGGGGGGVGSGVTLGRGVEGVVLVLAMEARVWTREVRMGVVGGRVGVIEDERVGREGMEAREETNWEGVRLVRV